MKAPVDRLPTGLHTYAPPSRFGKYVLEQRLAVGGSSEVYLARPAVGTLPAPQLVIKRLRPSVLESPQALGTFAMEARLHRAAQHPNVVQVFEAGSIEGEPFLAMEYVDGMDLFRLMRHTQATGHAMPAEVAVYIAMELCSALACVHRAVDDTGHPLAVVHRDVTPSNIYLSKQGDVKLGDFGIARQLTNAVGTSATSPLMGKYAYLSPEQVAGEDFDHRADLFSLAVVLAELLLNEPLFAGSGQLAVLLAIRDCRLDKLQQHATRLGSALLAVLQRALAREPSRRFSSALHFTQALQPFAAAREQAKATLAAAVSSARESFRPPACSPVRSEEARVEGPLTSGACVRMRDGAVIGPLSMAKVIELTATGRLRGDDEVDLVGTGFRALESVPELARHMPPSATGALAGPGTPDLEADLATDSMLDVCAHMLLGRETGVLFAEREDNGTPARKEIYLAQARVIHVASSSASELLGEYLVRTGVLDRAKLDLALAVMPQYAGRLGDTLIGLKLVDAVQIFRAIRDQGRDRIANLFQWRRGRLTFYRGVAPQRLEFPLDLDLAPLMLAGLESSMPDQAIEALHRPRQGDMLVAALHVPETLRLAAWPPEVFKVVAAAGDGRTEGDVVTALATARLIAVPQALRAIDVACAAGLLKRLPA